MEEGVLRFFDDYESEKSVFAEFPLRMMSS